VLLRSRSVGVDDPVAVDLLGEGVDVTEHRARHGAGPDVTVDRPPPTGRLGALDDHPLTRSGGVRDPSPVAEAATRWADPLSVLPGVDDDGVTGVREPGRGVDGPQRALEGAVGLVGPGDGDVELGGRRAEAVQRTPSRCSRA
jgi:hypothetical protein